MIHLDLFSGIGGFAYAADQVFGDVEHIFCEWDKFCQQVLKKHWPEATVYGDIKEITTNPVSERLERGGQKQSKGQRGQPSGARGDQEPRTYILTGGFPCQPFSAAGVRRGTADERYLWPEMLRVIRLTKPQWVIAENVRGLVTWEQGVVLEQVCTDLEASGYEVQPVIIPAVAVNAPHRRDRVWFIARNTEYNGLNGAKDPKSGKAGNAGNTERPDKVRQPKGTNPLWFDTTSWDKDWLEVATELCRMDDGVPKGVDRANQLKAYGNSIVPQVAIEIMRGMK